MKKYVSFFLIFIFLMSFTTAFAAEIPISEAYIGNNNIHILTSSGDVYVSEKDVTTQNKEFIVNNIKKIDGNFFIKNNGDVYTYNINYTGEKEEKILTGLNAKDIVNTFGCYYVTIEDGYRQSASADIITYIDVDNNLKFYIYDGKNSTSILVDTDVKEVLGKNSTGLEYVLLVHKQNGEVYYYKNTKSERDEHNGFQEMSSDIIKKFSKTFIASDISDISCGSFDSEYCLLKNNGELLSYKYDRYGNDKGTINVCNTNINTSFGIITYNRGSSVPEVACIDNSGTMYSYHLGSASKYETGRTIKDFAFNIENSHNKFIYIDGNGLLYQTKMAGGTYKSENTFCLSNDIKFKKLYHNGAFAMSENNELYAIGYNSTNGYKQIPDTLYKLNNVSEPIEIYNVNGDTLKHRSVLIIDKAGNCWGIPNGSYTNFLTSYCQKKIKVLFEDSEIKLTQKIQNKNGRTMYPFRECLENMGVSVIWDQENQIAIGEIPGVKIEFPIGQSEYWVNGQKHTMDVPSYIDNSIGRTYIPIRYAAEGLGFTVDWIEGTTENTIKIYK